MDFLSTHFQGNRNNNKKKINHLNGLKIFDIGLPFRQSGRMLTIKRLFLHVYAACHLRNYSTNNYYFRYSTCIQEIKY